MAENKQSLVCVGLDQSDLVFNQKIIDQTIDLVCAYKLNLAFYEADGAGGWESMAKTVDYIKQKNAAVMVIADGKMGDIGNTAEAYAKTVFDNLGFDAATVNPYLGMETLEPFLQRQDKLTIVLCRTSNPGAGEFQGLTADGKPVWQHVAEAVIAKDQGKGQMMLVAGATYPEDLAKIRSLSEEITLLVPGIGAQGGDLEAVLKAGLNKNKDGLIINSSRGICMADNPRLAAQELRDKINDDRNNL